MKTTATTLPGVLLIEPELFEDDRGSFFESYQQLRYQQAGITAAFVQDNVSLSRRDVLRGLHLQTANPQGKLVFALTGSIFDVAVDLRRGSPCFSRWLGVELSAANRRQLYIPPGFAHGFCVTSDAALVCYKCTDIYNPGAEFTIIWNDPTVQIAWPVATPVLSAKDAHGLHLSECDPARLPVYRG